jgi:hypothetical protein
MALKHDKDGFLVGRGGKDVLQIIHDNTKDILAQIHGKIKPPTNPQPRLKIGVQIANSAPKPRAPKAPSASFGLKNRDAQGQFVNANSNPTRLPAATVKQNKVTSDAAVEAKKSNKEQIKLLKRIANKGSSGDSTSKSPKIPDVFGGGKGKMARFFGRTGRALKGAGGKLLGGAALAKLGGFFGRGGSKGGLDGAAAKAGGIGGKLLDGLKGIGGGARAAGGLLKRIPLLGAAITGLFALSDMDTINKDSSLTDEQKSTKKAGVTGGAAGALGGMAAGAAIGTMIFPGVGTVIGGIIGGIGGEKIGKTVGEWLYKRDWKSAWDNTRSALSSGWSWMTISIKGFADTAWTSFTAAWKTTTDGITLKFTEIKEAFLAKATSFFDGVKNAWDAAKELVTGGDPPTPSGDTPPAGGGDSPAPQAPQGTVTRNKTFDEKMRDGKKSGEVRDQLVVEKGRLLAKKAKDAIPYGWFGGYKDKADSDASIKKTADKIATLEEAHKVLYAEAMKETTTAPPEGGSKTLLGKAVDKLTPKVEALGGKISAVVGGKGGGGYSPTSATVGAVGGELMPFLSALKKINEQCVSLVKAATKNNASTSEWRRGVSAADGTLVKGQGIATFLDRKFNQSNKYDEGKGGQEGKNKDHAMIFDSYVKDAVGKIVGLVAYETYRGSGGVKKKTYMFGQGVGEKNASNYAAINVGGNPLAMGAVTDGGNGGAQTASYSTKGVDPNKAARVEALNAQNNLPTGMLAGVWEQETKSGRDVRNSPKGAKGHFQFMPATAADMGIAGKENDFNAASEAAAKYLSQLYKMFGGDVNKTLAAYNWGSGNVSKKGLGNAPRETRNYMRDIGSFMQNRAGKIASASPPPILTAIKAPTVPTMPAFKAPDYAIPTFVAANTSGGTNGKGGKGGGADGFDYSGASNVALAQIPVSQRVSNDRIAWTAGGGIGMG